MDGFLLAVPCVCPAAKQAQALALQGLKAGTQQLEMQSDWFNGDVRDGANSFGVAPDPFPPPLSFILSFSSPTTLPILF